MDNKLNYTEENEEREDGKLSYRTPIYLQLREIIRNRIEEGEYLPGTAIPSENKLAETYGINRLTVRNAVDEDEEEAFSKEAVRIGMAERKAELDKLKEKGYQGGNGGGQSISSASSNTSKPKTTVNDEDIPF